VCVQHANRERQRAELEARQSKEAMASMGTRTAAAVAAHEATERVERAAREEAENKCQQLTLDLEWQRYSQEQVSGVMRAQEKRLGDSEQLNRSLLLRCKSVEALAVELTAELQKERRCGGIAYIHTHHAYALSYASSGLGSVFTLDDWSRRVV
jgi:hypothetical protein